MILVVFLANNEQPPDASGYNYDFIRQHQNSQYERVKKVAKMKKRIDRLSAKNRVVKRK